jgi:hypothetical protein
VRQIGRFLLESQRRDLPQAVGARVGVHAAERRDGAQRLGRRFRDALGPETGRAG